MQAARSFPHIGTSRNYHQIIRPVPGWAAIRQHIDESTDLTALPDQLKQAEPVLKSFDDETSRLLKRHQPRLRCPDPVASRRDLYEPTLDMET